MQVVVGFRSKRNEIYWSGKPPVVRATASGQAATRLGEFVSEKATQSSSILPAADLNSSLLPLGTNESLLGGIKEIASNLENAKDLAGDSLSDLVTTVSKSPVDGAVVSSYKAMLEKSPAFLEIQAFLYAVANALPQELKNTVGSLEQNPVNLAIAAATLLGLPIFAFWVIRFYGYSGDLTPRKALDTLSRGDALLVDIRSDAEREEGIPDLKRGARGRGIAVPLLNLQGKEKSMIAAPKEWSFQATATAIAGLRQTSSGGPVILIDSSGGGDAVSVAKLLAKQSFTNVSTIKGGFKSWKAAGLAVKQGVSSYQEGTIKVVAEKAGEFTEDLSKGFEAKTKEALTTPAVAFSTLCVLSVILLVGTGTYKKFLEFVGVFGISTTVFLRIISYNDASEAAKDAETLLKRVGIRLPEVKGVVRKVVVSLDTMGKDTKTSNPPVEKSGSFEKNATSEPRSLDTSEGKPEKAEDTTSFGDAGEPDPLQVSEDVAATNLADLSERKEEVRSWIENWRAQQSLPPQADSGDDVLDAESRVAEVQSWIANWRAKAASGSMENSTNEATSNSEEVRAWIENWRAMQPSSPQVNSVDSESRVAEVQSWIANWRAKAAPASMENSTNEATSNSEEVRAWIENWRMRGGK